MKLPFPSGREWDENGRISCMCEPFVKEAETNVTLDAFLVIFSCTMNSYHQCLLHLLVR
jgi:hypothetical protein